MNTSLQNIITRQITTLKDSQIRLLFQKSDYPRFELAEFRKNQELMGKEDFLFFIKILEKWNEQIVRRGDTLSDSAYTKNEFIFSWLKSLVVKNQRQIDSSLQQLFDWYNLTKSSEPTFFIKKEVKNKSHLEEWEVRNSYKSNLPLEIDTYKRRFIFNQTKQSPEFVNRTADHQLELNKQNRRRLRHQNNYLKNSREDEQVANYVNDYRKSKVYFSKNIAKNYYKCDFQKDKITASSNSSSLSKDLVGTIDEIKNYRIKTTMGTRPFDSSSKSMNKTLYSSFSKNFREINDKGCYEQLRLDCDIKLPYSNINGHGLIANPFEVKLRKKKKL